MKLFLQDHLPVPSASQSLEDRDVEVLHERTKWHRATFELRLRSIIRYLAHPTYIARGAAGYHRFDHCARIALPDPPAMTASLESVLAGRRSSQTLQGPVSLLQISGLAHHALRVNRRMASTAAPTVQICLRPYPSPGGLYPTETYFIVNEVDGLGACVAHYDARDHALAIIKEHDGSAFSGVEIRHEAGGIRAPLIAVMTTLPQRVTAKYGGRGYRMGLLEAGHASQNLCLVAEGLGMQSLVYGSYFDDELADLLDVDGVTETVVTTILIGGGQ